MTNEDASNVAIEFWQTTHSETLPDNDDRIVLLATMLRRAHLRGEACGYDRASRQIKSALDDTLARLGAK